MKRIVIAVLALLVFAAMVQAEEPVPTVISYQGKLNTAAGVPVNGKRSMMFEFYDLPERGERLAGFREVQDVVVVKGIFNVLIGSVTPEGVPPDVFRKPQVFLSVRVDEVELLPRQQVASVGFAYKAAEAGSASTATTATKATTADTATSSVTAQSIQTAAMQAPAVSSRAMPAYISNMVGQRKGAIRGSYTYGTSTGWMVVYELSHEIVSPRDAASGLPTGQIMNKPLTVVMPIDKATPLIYDSLATNENLSVVELRLMRKNASGADEYYYNIRLDNANVCTARMVIPDVLSGQNGNQGHMVEFSFTYQRITLTAVLDGTSTVIDWEQSPASP